MIIKKTIKTKKIFLVISLLFVFLLWLNYWTRPYSEISTTTKIYDQNKKLLYEASGGISSRQPIALAKIPEKLQQAVVVTEDERFWQHSGVDILAITRAATTNLQAGKIVSGGSTIPQQVARYTIINPQTPAPANLIRKIRESLVAIRLLIGNSREDILEIYLNNMHFGYDTYGVQAASKMYFDHDVQTLSLSESALLAGMIANPSLFDPIRFPEKAKMRRKFVLDTMLADNLISKEEHERAVQDPLPVAVQKNSINAPHFVQMVLDEVESLNLPKNKGLAIHTTIDLNWYSYTRQTAQLHIEKLKQQHNLNNAAIVMIENKTGNIIALVGSIDFFNSEIDGQNNMATALRQPGSAMKLVTYAAAFQDGLATPATMIIDEPKTYITHDGHSFQPHNYSGRYHGPVLVREALASSYNMPAVEMLDKVGIKRFLELSHQMGITSMKREESYDLALTLGGGEVSLLELTNLYATFAREGEWLPTRLVSKVENDHGDTIYTAQAQEPTQTISKEVAWLITSILSDEKARIPTFGEKNYLVTPQQAAVKTGTTTNWHDNWTVGYTPSHTVGVWVGNANNEPMKDITGVTGAAPIWNAVFTEIYDNNLGDSNKESFHQPEKITTTMVCAWDGLLPTEACTEQYKEVFIQGSLPTEETPLLKKQSKAFSTSSPQILNPKEGGVYEVGYSSLDTLTFEVSPKNLINKVIWILDEKVFNNCTYETKSECGWHPTRGEHNLGAIIHTESGKQIEASTVHFRVVGYKEEF